MNYRKMNYREKRSTWEWAKSVCGLAWAMRYEWVNEWMRVGLGVDNGKIKGNWIQNSLALLLWRERERQCGTQTKQSFIKKLVWDTCTLVKVLGLGNLGPTFVIVRWWWLFRFMMQKMWVIWRSWFKYGTV